MTNSKKSQDSRPSEDKLVLYCLLNDTFEIEGEPFEPYAYQLDIADQIYFRKNRRIIISAARKVGKTLCVALTAILYAMKYEDHKIRIVAPNYQQAKILMNYIRRHLEDSETIVDALPVKSKEKIQSEISKERIEFENGSNIQILSAHGEAKRLFGHGADLLIVDESALIDDDTFKARIETMLEESVDSMLVEIGNPVALNHFKEHWESDYFHNIHIDWEDAVEAGRHNPDDIEEKKRSLTETEFKMQYEAKFPESLENSLFRYDWLEAAVNKEMEMGKDKEVVWGLDVARLGADKIVLVEGVHDDGEYDVRNIYSWEHQRLNKTREDVEAKVAKGEKIIIDEGGLGGGLVDELDARGYDVVGFNFGSSAKNKDRFRNKKAEGFWRLREAFEEGRISIPNNRTLMKQLRKMRYEHNASDKIEIVDPTKSPDYADALMLLVGGTQVEDSAEVQVFSNPFAHDSCG